MTEIYNFGEQGLGYGNLILVLLGIVFVIGAVIALLVLIKTYFANKMLFVKTWGYFKILVIIIVALSISIIFIPKQIKTFLLYFDYQRLMDEKAYIVEIGKIQNLATYEVINNKIQDKYDGYDERYDYPYGSEISFYLNGQFFDTIDSYGQNCFSKKDLELIAASDIIEVKYVIKNDVKVILSLSIINE